TPDEAFLQDVLRETHSTLLVVGAFEIAAALLAAISMMGSGLFESISVVQITELLFIGGSTIHSRRVRALYPHSLVFAATSCWSAAAFGLGLFDLSPTVYMPGVIFASMSLVSLHLAAAIAFVGSYVVLAAISGTVSAWVLVPAIAAVVVAAHRHSQR